MIMAEALELLKKVKMTKECQNCSKFKCCNNNNLLCRKQVISEFTKAVLENTFNKEAGEK